MLIAADELACLTGGIIQKNAGQTPGIFVGES
jgi:hypothetical protein